MFALPDAAASARFVARRVLGWRQHGDAITVEVEGVRDPDTTDVAAVLAGARLDDALDRVELTISVLELGAVRLQLDGGRVPDPGALDGDELVTAAIGVTAADGLLRLVSERHGGYGPDPENLTVEIALDPLALAVLDAAGRRVFSLVSEAPDAAPEPGGPRVAPFAWVRQFGADGPTRSAMLASIALEPGERLFGLGAQSGPLDLMGSTRTVAPPAAEVSGPGTAPAAREARQRPPFLLSSRGYGVLVHTDAALAADLAVGAEAVATVAVADRALDLVIFPATWPRAALAGYARLTGRERAPAPWAFDVAGAGTRPAPATVAELHDRLLQGLSFGVTTPGPWRADLNPAPGMAASPALLARWAQLALLSPLAGIGAGLPGDPAWSDERARQAVRAYLRLRRRLVPYLLHCAREMAQAGLPMLRPLFLEFSWDPDAVAVEDQFLLGRDLLVAPVFSDSLEPVSRRVYLPAYASWYDWWTGMLYEGRQWVEATVPLDRVPIYARAGTTIPLADPHPADHEGPPSAEVTRLLLFAPREGAVGASVELADDDMLGVEQERGDRKARIFVEGIPPTIRDLQVVGLPAGTRLVDASSPRIVLEAADTNLPGHGATWQSLVIRLEPGAFTAGLELAW